jgi:hypothetical protein
MMNVQGDQSQAKWQKMFKKFENSSKKTMAEQSDIIRISYGILQQILIESLNMCRIAVQFIHKLLKNQKQWHIKVCPEL